MIKAGCKWAIIVNMIIVTLSGTLASDPEDVFNCSRYEFYTDSKKWTESKEECKNKNGTLICMETIEEWNFIKKKIDENYGKEQQWFIGLRCQSKDETMCKEHHQWSWVNGESLNWKLKNLPWQSGNNKADGNGRFAKVWKNEYGRYFFDDVRGRSRNMIGYICEYPNVNSGTCKLSNKPLETTLSSVSKTTTGTQSTTNKKSTATSATTKKIAPTTNSRQSTEAPWTTESSVPTTNTNIVRTIQSNSVTSSQSTMATSIRTHSRIITPYRTLPITSPNPTENISGDKQIQKEEFPITYLAIALAVLLMFLICMLIAIYCWRNKNKDKVQGSEEVGIKSPTTDVSDIIKSNSFVAFKMVHNNIGDPNPPGAKPANDSTPTDGTYAEINLKRSTVSTTPESKEISGQIVNVNENLTCSPSQDGKKVEVVYAAVDKSAKRKKGNQEPQVTYADLASFNNNEDTVVHMPPPYQPVQYAEIIGTKKSKNN